MERPDGLSYLYRTTDLCLLQGFRCGLSFACETLDGFVALREIHGIHLEELTAAFTRLRITLFLGRQRGRGRLYRKKAERLTVLAGNLDTTVLQKLEKLN